MVIRLRALESLEMQDVTIWASSLSRLSSLSSLKFPRIGEFSWSPELGDFRSLPSLYKGWVNNGRSNDSVSPDREEDNHVSSVPNGGCIEEPERTAGETPGPSTVISRGTDGVESFVQSVMLPFLWHVVDNLGNWERMFEKFNLENVLRNAPSYSDRLNQITNNMRSNFPRLLQLLERNPSLSLEELKVFCVPMCWSSTQCVGFAGHLSDRLFLKAQVPDQQDDSKEDPLLKELESKWPLVFDGQWIKRIDEGWINKINHKSGRIRKSDYESVKGLFRFMRNRWHHSDEFQESHELRNAQSFYNYFDERFPNLLMLSYGAAYRLCREEPWFKDYLPS